MTKTIALGFNFHVDCSMRYSEVLNQAWQDHLVPKKPDAPIVISTFAGCGGSSLGYSMAGFRECLAIEWDDHAVQVFKHNFPHVPVYHGDIAKLSVEECLERAAAYSGENCHPFRPKVYHLTLFFC